MELLQINPAKRMTMQDLKNHPYLSNGEWDSFAVDFYYITFFSYLSKLDLKNPLIKLNNFNIYQIILFSYAKL